ncbi:MAG TPA: S24 family peptidase [Thermomicrobiales bacterium]|nr:S24 family peptidase [Thermomicrobiales bacterium]
MGAGDHETTALWREIDALLADTRAARPLDQSDALLDLDRVADVEAAPCLHELARALDGWDGRLLLRAPDDALAPEVRAGDRLVIAPGAAAGDGALVVAVAAGALTVRRLRAREGRAWLEAGSRAPLALGPLVAILGVVVELRRAV